MNGFKSWLLSCSPKILRFKLFYFSVLLPRSLPPLFLLLPALLGLSCSLEKCADADAEADRFLLSPLLFFCVSFAESGEICLQLRPRTACIALQAGDIWTDVGYAGYFVPISAKPQFHDWFLFVYFIQSDCILMSCLYKYSRTLRLF